MTRVRYQFGSLKLGGPSGITKRLPMGAVFIGECRWA